jgi:ribosomal protein L37AE/L43A
MANREKIVCVMCKKPISGARTVINGQWHCADCTYRIDFPDVEIPESAPRRFVRRVPGDQTLFETDQYVRQRDA